jgi:predicted nucleic acid-binding protein
VRRILLDTGALVALLDRSERHHRVCLDFFSAYRGDVLTTEPVLTEALYLLNRTPNAIKACFDFILQGGATLVPQSSSSLRRSAELMKTYADTPMDFADATLVALAEETDAREVFTLDRRGFSAYRIRRRGAFSLFPS